MNTTKNYLKNRLEEVESMLVWSARVAKGVSFDDGDKHTEERVELLKERMYLLSVLYLGRTKH